MVMDKETVRKIKFALFSASAGIIETLAMILFEEIIKLPGHYLCYTIALILSVLWNFTFNRKFTFKSAANVPKAMLLMFFLLLISCLYSLALSPIYSLLFTLLSLQN